VKTPHPFAIRHIPPQASMGPRFCKRGNPLVILAEIEQKYSLQWGHAFVSVETACVQCNGQSGATASMGPRFCKRGNMFLVRGDAESVSASMGPRFCKRGNLRLGHRPPPHRHRFNGATLL